MRLFLISIITWLLTCQQSEAQLPACCSQPGACQSFNEFNVQQDVNDNSIQVVYHQAASDGYLFIPGPNGDYDFTPILVRQQGVTTSARLRATKGLFVTMRLPVRYIQNSSSKQSNAGIGDAVLGIQRVFGLNKFSRWTVHISGQIPSGHSVPFDTSMMYQTLLQTGSGNLNIEYGFRFQQMKDRLAWSTGASYRHSIMKLYNYQNGSLFTYNTGLSYTKTAARIETQYQLQVIGEWYQRDRVNKEKAYNTGYILASMLPRVHIRSKKILWFSQVLVPFYRNYFGHQLKLNYTFTTGVGYVF